MSPVASVQTQVEDSQEGQDSAQDAKAWLGAVIQGKSFPGLRHKRVRSQQNWGITAGGLSLSLHLRPH